MLRVKTLVTILTFAVVLSAWPQDAQAGPLMDWFRGIRCRRAARAGCNTCPTPACNPCSTGSMVNTSFQQPATSLAGLQPGQCIKTCNQTCSRTVVNYVPYTAYRTAWNRVPVTQYRPVTNSDPCTGCTVTCMKPCTTYTWQMKREPYTTYRPCYRQENYTVPVTTITNDCATGACNTCPTPTATCPTCPTATCPTCPTASAAQVIYPSNGSTGTATNLSGTYYTYPQGSVTAPNGSISTEGTYQSSPYSTPADTTPSLDVNPQNTQRPVMERLIDGDDSSTFSPRINGPLQTKRRPINQISPVSDPNAAHGWMNSSPNYVPSNDKSARSPVTERWSYTPVRLASYTSTKAPQVKVTSGPTRITGTFVPATSTKVRPASKPRKLNSGWKTVEW